MNYDIQPEKREVLFHDTSCDTYFIVVTTLKPTRTAEYKGKTYPYMPIDVSSESHPFYTGKERESQNEGRVARFNKRYNKKGEN